MALNWHLNYSLQSGKQNDKKLHCNIVRNKKMLHVNGSGSLEEGDDEILAMIEAVLRKLFEDLDDQDGDLQAHMNIMEQTAEYATGVRAALKDLA